MKVRIQKLLADAGVESRRHVEEMVLQARISVNGRVVTKLPVMVDPDVDQIAIDNEPIKLPKSSSGGSEKIYVLMNKPAGVYCTNVAQGEQRRAIDLLPPEIDKRIYPVGRLDADSRGLLLLTNDGDLTQRLTHPKFGVAKTYTVVVDGFIKPETVERMTGGVWLADPEKGGFKTGRTFIKVIRRATKQSVLQVTIREGRNRQVRRMLAAVGHKVRDLTRTKIGPLELGKLKPGGFRILNLWEVDKLREAIQPKPRPGSKPREKPDGALSRVKPPADKPKPKIAPPNSIGAKSPGSSRGGGRSAGRPSPKRGDRGPRR